MSEYGPLAPLVVYAGNLGAAAIAIRVAWTGKAANWEPEIKDLPKAPKQVAGLIAIIGIAALFVVTRNRPDFENLLWLSGVLLLIGLIGFFRYVFLIKTRVFSCPGDENRYVRGDVLTQTATDILAGKSKHLFKDQEPPTTDRELFCGAGKVSDRVWTDESVAKSHLHLIAAYIIFVAAGTIAVSSASIAIEKVLGG